MIVYTAETLPDDAITRAWKALDLSDFCIAIHRTMFQPTSPDDVAFDRDYARNQLLAFDMRRGSARRSYVRQKGQWVCIR